MRMTPKYYFENFVRSSYEEFCEEEGNIRKAFHAVVSLSYMAENYFNYYKRRGDSRVSGFKDFKDFYAHLVGKTPYVKDIRNILHAYQQLFLNAGLAYLTVESGGAVYLEETPESKLSVDDVELEGAYCSSSYFMKQDGNSIRVKDVLEAVVKVWEKLFAE